MKRIPEPELMLEELQAKAYAEDGFEKPPFFINVFREFFGNCGITGHVLDLGCGPRGVLLFDSQMPIQTVQSMGSMVLE